MKYYKQLTINRLNLPSELQYIIKSYCFYDKKTYETMKCIKNKISEIDYNFKNISFSRANPIDLISTIDSDEDEHWIFSYDITSNSNKQFQAINCKYCGNYVMCNGYSRLSQKLKCNCNLNGE